MAYRKRSWKRKRPVSRRPRRSYRKRSYAKRRYQRVSKKVFSGIPDRIFTKMTYAMRSEDGPVVVPVGTAQCLCMIRNSCNSPQRIPASGGHQPLWFDQWFPHVYNKYRVYGVKYDVTVNNIQLNQSWNAFVAPQDGDFTETNVNTLLEQRNVHRKVGGGTGTPTQEVRLKGYWSVPKTVGVSKSQVKNSEGWGAVYNADPANLVYLAVYAGHNYWNNSAYFDYTAKFTYYVECYDRAIAVQS